MENRLPEMDWPEKSGCDGAFHWNVKKKSPSEYCGHLCVTEINKKMKHVNNLAAHRK